MTIKMQTDDEYEGKILAQCIDFYHDALYFREHFRSVYKHLELTSIDQAYKILEELYEEVCMLRWINE